MSQATINCLWNSRPQNIVVDSGVESRKLIIESVLDKQLRSRSHYGTLFT